MKRIKNHAMARGRMNVPNVGVVVGDEHGVFEVPDEFAADVLGTPGWSDASSDPDSATLNAALEAQQKAAAEANAAAEAALAAAEAERAAAREAGEKAAREAVVVKADAAAEKAAVDAAKAAEKPAEEETEEGPDLESLDREGLLKVAEEYGVTVSQRWGEKRLRTVLDSALYGDGSNDGSSEGDEA